MTFLDPMFVLTLIAAVWSLAILGFAVFVHGGRRKRYPSPPIRRNGVDLAA